MESKTGLQIARARNLKERNRGSWFGCFGIVGFVTPMFSDALTNVRGVELRFRQSVSAASEFKKVVSSQCAVGSLNKEGIRY